MMKMDCHVYKPRTTPLFGMLVENGNGRMGNLKNHMKSIKRTELYEIKLRNRFYDENVMSLKNVGGEGLSPLSNATSKDIREDPEQKASPAFSSVDDIAAVGVWI